MKHSAAVIALMLSASFAGPALAEPGWNPTVIATGPLKTQIDNTNILLRPYRPFHFYGNTVRRRHYRGRATPTLQDMRQSVRVLILRR
jgi:hypothetical protein